MNISLARRPEQAQQRRLSRALRASLAPTNDQTPLDVLEHVLGELAGTFGTFQKNFENLKGVHDSLLMFNESFSAFLYGLKVNVHCSDFSEAPTRPSFERAAQRIGQSAMTPRTLFLRPPPRTPKRDPEPERVCQEEMPTPPPPQQTPQPARRPKKVKSKALQVKTLVTKVINGLPIKYREQQPHRENTELIVKSLILNPNGLYIEEIIKRTGAPRVRCNEYLNALVHAKEVVKLSKKGQLFKMDPVKYPLNRKS